jgi:G3E family GTPase
MVKFDIISGFLGAGKTTLIQQILNSVRNEKVVIIENEYGETSIDSEILRVAGFELYELTHGCVCCTLKEDFRRVLKELLDQKVDRIIFEPSGIFILSEILDLFKDLQISSRCTLNSVTTVVDVTHFFKNVNSYAAFFTHQIQSANTLVLSKTQQVTPQDVREIILELRKLNEGAVILSKNWQELSSRDFSSILNEEQGPALQGAGEAEPSVDFEHNFESFGMQTFKRFEIRKLKQILESCKKGEYGQILRGKGILQSVDTFLEFNYVDGDYQFREHKESLLGGVSFIGKELETEKLRKVFN